MRYLKRESLFKKLFLLYDWAKKAGNVIQSLSWLIIFIFALVFIGLLIFDFGFSTSQLAADGQAIYLRYRIILLIIFTSKCIIELFLLTARKWLSSLFKFIILLLVFLLLAINFGWLYISTPWLHAFLVNKYTLIISFLVLIISESYRLSQFTSTTTIPTALLFAGSFLLIIFIGSGLLMLPNATFQSISYLDALFTATSAVCVTGLTVVDTASIFTPMGKAIIMLLIQIGGLGIMTFTAFFSFLFLGSASFKDRLLLKDIISGDQLSGLYKILLKILLITVLIESGGAIALYYSLDGYWAQNIQDSIFHSISAFCNAGFSPYPQGLYTEMVRKNYLLHLIICGLIILGGIGFPVLLNFYKLLKHLMRSGFNLLTGRRRAHKVFPLAIGERLAFGTTVVLLVAGTVFYYLFEKSGSLQSTDPGARWVVSFFSSVTARTAGFNVVDINAWCYPTVFLVIFLMWIGASPGSTGGGIKTTTLALSLKAVLNFCRGGKLLEIGNREIGPSTLIRVLSVIVLSLSVIFVGFMLLLIFEPEKNPVHLLFESVSAFSTTGLSLVNSAILSVQSKIVLIALMFIGRIGPVILLAGILVSRKKQYYRLPVENIKIT